MFNNFFSAFTATLRENILLPLPVKNRLIVCCFGFPLLICAPDEVEKNHSNLMFTGTVYADAAGKRTGRCAFWQSNQRRNSTRIRRRQRSSLQVAKRRVCFT